MSKLGKLQIKNPLPPLYRGKNDRQNVYKKVGLIPYRGTTSYSSDNFLNLLFDLYELSPSFGAVVNDIVYYGFEGDIDLTEGQKAGLKLANKEPIDDSRKVEYCEFLEGLGLSFLQIKKASKKIIKFFKICGNAYVYFRRVSQNGVNKCIIKVYDPRYVKYREKKNDFGFDTVAISSSFILEHRFWSQDDEDYKICPVYPNYRETETLYETMFHLKNEDGQSDIYGMPEDIQAMYAKYSEYALGSHSAKVNDKETTAKYMLQTPRLTLDTIKAGNDAYKKQQIEFKRALSRIASNEGDNPDSIVTLPPPVGSEGDYKLMKMDINRDIEWYKGQKEEARNDIYSLNRSHQEITGARESKGSLGSDSLTALFVKYDIGTVSPYQGMVSDFWMDINNAICDSVGNTDFKNIKYLFPKKITEYVETMRDAKEANKEARGINTNGVNES